MARKIFEKVKMRSPKRSAFDLSHEVKTSGSFADLLPVNTMEVVPGDQIAMNTEALVRMAPTIAPIMHRIDVYVHHFFVPNRIIMPDWETFIFPTDDSGTLPTLPKVTITDLTPPDLVSDRSLWSRLGLPTFDPTQLTGQFQVNALPFRAYQEIYNEYYRDQNLIEKVDIEDPSSIVSLRRRAWEKDYFTSSLPFALKGPQVDIGLGINYADVGVFVDQAGNPADADGDVGNFANGNINSTGFGSGQQAGNIQNIDDASLNIEDLRRGARLQEWLERAARGGTRYKEALLSFFGVTAGDARLDRPEYLGGGRQPITISEVLNTTGIASSGTTPDSSGAVQGDMAGHGIAVGANNNFKYSVKEHGYIMSILSILPKASYQQGVPRHFQYQDRYDYYWKEFANIGEQEVSNSELYWTPDGGSANSEIFGYQQRYAHYKYACNHTSGDMRSNLDFWHVGRKFLTRPVLDQTFIEPTGEDDLSRIFAVDPKTTGSDPFWIQLYHDVKARRPMPYFSNPTL